MIKNYNFIILRYSPVPYNSFLKINNNNYYKYIIM